MIKFNKTKKIAKTGQYHTTFEAAYNALPGALIARCTAAELALIIDYGQTQKIIGQNETYAELNAKEI